MKKTSLCVLILLLTLLPAYAISSSHLSLDNATNKTSAHPNQTVQLASNAPTVYDSTDIAMAIKDQSHQKKMRAGLNPAKPAPPPNESFIYWLSLLREPTSMFLLGTTLLLIAGVFRRMGETVSDKLPAHVVHEQ